MPELVGLSRCKLSWKFPNAFSGVTGSGKTIVLGHAPRAIQSQVLSVQVNAEVWLSHLKWSSLYWIIALKEFLYLVGDAGMTSVSFSMVLCPLDLLSSADLYRWWCFDFSWSLISFRLESTIYEHHRHSSSFFGCLSLTGRSSLSFAL